MRIFLAGGTGVIGRALIPLLASAGHEVWATTRAESRCAALAAVGAAIGAPDPLVPPGNAATASGRAVSAARAHSLGWSPTIPTWRAGFRTGLAAD